MEDFKIICLTPVYNDWESFEILSQKIIALQKQIAANIKIIAINDGSTEAIKETILNLPNVEIKNLKTNVGHQRAIGIGLQYIFNEEQNYNYVVVMDSDGEDNPNQIKELLEKAIKENNQKIIFAQRKKRTESLIFKTGYYFYKAIFKFLTGQTINFGNYSIIPKQLLSKVVHQSNLWNHYSGGIIQAKIPYDKVHLDRGKRYKGKSKMNFNNLVLHGLSSISVYFDLLSVRILKFTLYGIALCLLSVFYILYQKLFTDNAIPGWASSLILIISGIILQLFSVTLIVLLLQLSTRKNISVPNTKIYKEFIEGTNSNNLENEYIKYD
ncbi:glycosyltransferase [Flavobacterium sp.]|uniref:glycosyltransferase n=1 Tax=Flavobacterium sp. TaxID=239 RepID=UPI003526C518